MHMADALISPVVGGTMWVVTASLIAWCSRKVKEARDDRLIPTMGVLGAFIFSAQMINFSIPITGSSGHLGGGLILAILLGPYAAFLVIASVLTVQALMFADGGLLALGCNIFNLGFPPAFIAYPLLYKLIAGKYRTGARAWSAAVVAGIIGLQLGSLGVVFETWLSGISELPFKTFILIMQPIHLAVGIVEGLVTATVVAFVASAQPEGLAMGMPAAVQKRERNGRPLLFRLLIVAAILGGAVSWIASTRPDGLEWSITRVTGQENFSGIEAGVHGKLAAVQSKTALLPDYGFKVAQEGKVSADPAGSMPTPWPAGDAGTSVSGLVGGLLTFILVGLIGFALKVRTKWA